MLIENVHEEGGNQVDMVARQLNEYFDCPMFLQRGNQIMDKWHKHRDNYHNFLTRYAELKPS